jgi:cell division protein FtsB
MRYWQTPGNTRGREGNGTGGRRRSISSGGNLRDYPFLRTFYRHQEEISGGLQKFLFFIFLATLLYAFVLGDAGAIRIAGLKKERAKLEAEVHSVQVDIRGLQAAIDRLNSDPFMKEKLGRELYGLAEPDDVVIKLVPEKVEK